MISKCSLTGQKIWIKDEANDWPVSVLNPGVTLSGMGREKWLKAVWRHDSRCRPCPVTLMACPGRRWYCSWISSSLWRLTEYWETQKQRFNKARQWIKENFCWREKKTPASKECPLQRSWMCRWCPPRVCKLSWRCRTLPLSHARWWY